MHYPAGELPRLHGATRLGGGKMNDERQIYDVKFYPYSDPTDDPVFAVVAGRDIFVYRPNPTKVQGDPPFHLLQQIRDPDEDVSLNSLVWSQDVTTGEPLLCVAGSGFKSIKIFSVTTGQLFRVMSGHGGDINDLAISPVSPEILASCSADCHIRLWTLNLKYQKQPCAAILSGAGHTQPILTLAFHVSGKYLLSGGQDTMVCLWYLPDVPITRTGIDQPDEVHYPLFVTTEVHADYVDCVKFYGDLIISRAAGGSATTKSNGKSTEASSFKRNDILLWKIDGFPATGENIKPPAAVHGVHTRSAFGGRFQRLLTFEIYPATPFYMRFSLFDQPGHRPILAMGNELSRYSFWDLDRLLEGHDVVEEAGDIKDVKPTRRRRGGVEGAFGSIGANLGREGSTASNASSAKTSYQSDPSSVPSELKFDIADPYKPLVAHKRITVPCAVNFACRQVAWSNCGTWCVAVGDYAMMVAFKRGMHVSRKEFRQQHQQKKK